MEGGAGVPDRRGPSRRGLLASDADRERVIDRLKWAYSEGRLTADEHDDRVGRAYTSRTYGELADLVADLPSAPGGGLPAVSTTYQPYPVYPSARPAPPFVSYPVAPVRETNSQAVASLLCGLAGLPFGIPAVAAVVLGHSARSAIRQSGENGDSAATAGVVLGYLGIVLWTLIVLSYMS